MSRILPILKMIGRVGQIIALISMFAMNGLMAYIMFAPDEMPKPFYLNYKTTGLAVASTTAVPNTYHPPAPTPAPTADPSTIFHPGDGLMIDTGTKVINLADPGGRRYSLVLM